MLINSENIVQFANIHERKMSDRHEKCFCTVIKTFTYMT